LGLLSGVGVGGGSTTGPLAADPLQGLGAVLQQQLGNPTSSSAAAAAYRDMKLWHSFDDTIDTRASTLMMDSSKQGWSMRRRRLRQLLVKRKFISTLNARERERERAKLAF
jgi:hypothetical protein